jgi:hypothetical protein
MAGGISLQNASISSGGVRKNAKNSSVDYLAVQFRIQPWMGMTIGLLPASYVGYSVADTQTTNGTGIDKTLTYSRQFSGDGGLHEVFGGLGVKVLKNLSIGANFGYLWGDITRSWAMLPSYSGTYNTSKTRTLTITDYKLDFGLQYTQKLDKKHSVTIGAVFSPKHNLHNTYNVGFQKYTVSSSDQSVSIVTSSTQKPDASFSLPNTFGIGFTYNYANKLTIGADYSLQKWSKAIPKLNETSDANTSADFGETYQYKDRSKISVGAEYIPNMLGRSYFSLIKYRAGVYYSTPYYEVNGKRASREFGLTAGFGLPLPRVRSILSISAQYSRVKGLETNMVNENIFRLSIGFTFNETWFFKRRVE